VAIEGEKEVQLNREELMLSRGGYITLGKPGAQAAEAIEFSITRVAEV
jgi:hypothetical protein